MIRLIAKDPDNLLSVLLNREITPEQLETIRIVLEDDKMAFNVREDVRIENLIRDRYSNWAALSSTKPKIAKRRYIVVLDMPDVGEVDMAANWINTKVGPGVVDPTVYDTLEDLLYDFSRQEGAWDPDQTKNVTRLQYDLDDHPWVK